MLRSELQKKIMHVNGGILLSSNFLLHRHQKVRVKPEMLAFTDLVQKKITIYIFFFHLSLLLLYYGVLLFLEFQIGAQAMLTCCLPS